MNRKYGFYKIMFSAFAMTIAINISLHEHAQMVASQETARAATFR